MQTERQLQIMNASLELISEKGIQGFTIKNISKKIGISEPAIYRHFDNKIQILITILESFKSNSSRILQEISVQETNNIEKLLQIFTTHFNIFIQMPALTSVVFAEEIFRNEDQLVNRVQDIVAQSQQMVENLVKNGQIAGEIRDDLNPEDLAIVIMGTLRLYIKKWQFAGFTFNLNKEGEKIKTTIKQILK